MCIYFLKGVTKNYIWGGDKLNGFYKYSVNDKIAESWELSFFPGNESIILYGEHTGKKLSEVVSESELGSNIHNHPFFPILIKFIDANDDLSIQVHPSDEYALKYENSYGKTEMWYVIDADENSYLHIGFNKDVTKEEVEERIKNNTILDILNHYQVKKGDCFFIPAGTIHAIGKGCLVYEVQENSNLTYRVYDYNRVDKDGNPRELHIEKALNVLDLNKFEISANSTKNLANCKYFEVYKENNLSKIETNDKSFACLSILKGGGEINGLRYQKGDTIFIGANSVYEISGDNEIIVAKMN